MRRRSSSGWKVWLLAFVALLVAIRWWRCRSASEPPPGDGAAAPARRDAAVADAAAPATRPVPIVDAPVAVEVDAALRAPAPVFDDWNLEAISLDGTTALVSKYDSFKTPPHYQVIAIDTGVVEADLELKELFEISGQLSTEGVATDLRRARSHLKRFPLGSGGRIASTPDGERGAFNYVDATHVVTGDTVGAAIRLPAAYDPLVTPDGTTLVVRGYDGRIAGSGKYSLFTLPIGGGKPKKVAGTDGWNGHWALSKTGSLRIVVGQPGIPTCVLDVALVAPFRVGPKQCFDGAEPLDVELSPSGDWIAWSVAGEGEGAPRVRSVELTTGRAGIDVRHPGFLTVADNGRVLVVGNGTTYDYDATSGSPRTIDLHDLGCIFRGGSELVCWRAGAIVKIDLP